MSSEEVVQMSAEQLWGLSNNEDIEQYRGEDVEITEHDHKIARDFAEFAKMEIHPSRENEVRIYDGTSAKDDDDDEDEEFFDHVTITRI
ncbi:hypothetical protein GPJ56_006112 [Histomonas meleagridis]|uniref:uncharacterized protein n=1 Tax=Histomonas meleagridis TaxID=135588 RepID=UPI0035597B2D|nr:hypothetical protein GPJ56_006112 [Histomonas meleagridis]KAH0804036.1 hypothetical protein GO595_002866 [Histomonas meleagridis]